MPCELSRFATSTLGSAVVGMRRRADAIAATGIEIIDFGAGEPDFDVPEPVREAAIRAIREGHGHYVDPRGLPDLRAGIARFEADRHGLRFHPDQVVVTAGSFAGLSIATRAILEPGDEIIVIEPCWGPYRNLAVLTGAVPVAVPMEATGGRFVLDAARIHAAITPKTKAIVLNSPWNPTGRVVSEAELTGLAELADRHDLWIIADEVYAELVFDGARHVSIAALDPSIAERTITISSFSKSFAMTGWRLGYCMAPPAVTEVLARLNHYTTRCATSIVQYAGIAALAEGSACVEDMRIQYQQRRDTIVEGLRAIPGVQCPSPEGTFYAFARVPLEWGDSRAIAQYLLESHGIIVSAGAAYGASSSRYLRFSFATSLTSIEEGLSRMCRALPPPTTLSTVKSKVTVSEFSTQPRPLRGE